VVYERFIFPVERSWGSPVDEKGRWRTFHDADTMNPPIIWDGLVDPILPIHIEVFYIRGDGCECWYPDLCWEIKPEVLKGRPMEEFMKISPGPHFQTEDGRWFWQHRPMYHPHNEAYLFLPTDISNPLDLGGEEHLWLGLGDCAEEHVITKPTLVWIPKGLVHTPHMFKNVRKPFLKIVIVPDHPTVVEHSVDVWPRDYKPFPERPPGAIDKKTLKIVGPKPIHKLTFP